jgi:di/tricarboxylate transporter
MTAGAWIAIAVLLSALALMIFSRIEPALLMCGAVVILLTTGVVTADQALAGFSNEGMVTVALMYVIVAGIRETGGVDHIVHHVLGRPQTMLRALARLVIPVAAVSGFMNNTPLVATFLPAVMTWSKRIQISPSKLLIPLSYAAVIGGTLTIIGTSTNLVVDGLLRADHKPALGFFDIAWVGLPATLVAIAYLLFIAPRLLPARVPASGLFQDTKEYTVEMMVVPHGPLVNRTIEAAGLRHLQGLFLIEIEREDHLLVAVGPHERLRGGDRLVFAGIIDSVVELRRMNGLVPSAEREFRLDDRAHPERMLVEVVVSPNCGLLGKSIREGRFRQTYGAAIIAVARNGERLQQKVGDIVLESADTLLIEANPAFVEQHRNSKEFLLVSQVSDYSPVRHERAWLSWSILAGVVIAASVGWLPMLKAAMIGAALMLLTGCCTMPAVRRSIDFNVLLAIAAAFGLGKALEVTGAANAIAQGFLQFAGTDPWVTLALVYVLAMVLTELLSNNAVAVLMYPIVIAIAAKLGANYLPFVIALMMAASAGFATPIGYQTNLMVYGPGGYRFGDFVRAGAPLNALIALVTIAIVPRVWPF